MTRKTAKNSKLSKLLESCFEPAGKGGWPQISTWIIHTYQSRKYIIPFIPKGEGNIKVDIGGHPPIPLAQNIVFHLGSFSTIF
jgi:hypothetical protein